MEKYIIILLLLTSIYYIQNKLKDTEGFADSPAQSLGGVDDANAINTLAQIARQLMNGSLTVPGTITLKGDLTFPEPNKIHGAGRLHISSGEILYLLPKTNVTIGKEWGGTGDLVVQGNQSVGNTISVANNENANIQNPNTVTRINARGIIFGGPNNGYEANSAQITAGMHQADSLCMVGMGKPGAGRKIDMWAEERVAIHGSLVVDGNSSVGGNHRVQGKGMRLFTMQVGDNAETPIKDPNGNQYKWGEWVCCVQGLRMDWGGRGPGAISQFCHQRDGLWWIRSECEGEGDSGWPIILAIPWGFFDSVWEPPNGPGYMGGW